MASFIIYNNTAIPKSYLSGAVSLSANGNYTTTNTTYFPLSRDTGLLQDCLADNVYLSDGNNSYEISSAEVFLNRVATSIGGSVVGYTGATVPLYSITTGGVDPNGNTIISHFDSAGSLFVAGGIASLATDSGNPLKIGAVFTSTDPHPTNGQRVDLQTNLNSALNVQFRNSFRNLTGNATTTVKSGAGVLHSITINDNTTNGTVTVYDNTAGSGTKIFTFSVGTPSGGLLSSSGMPGPFSTGPLGLEFSTGLTVVTAGSSSNDVTVVYR